MVLRALTRPGPPIGIRYLDDTSYTLSLIYSYIPCLYSFTCRFCDQESNLRPLLGLACLLHLPGVLSGKATDYDLTGPASNSTSLTLPTGTPKPCSWKNKEAASQGDSSVPIN